MMPQKIPHEDKPELAAGRDVRGDPRVLVGRIVVDQDVQLLV